VGSTDTVADDEQTDQGRGRRLKHSTLGSAADVTELVPRGLRVSAALAWRFIVVIAGLYVIIWLAGFFPSC